MMKILRVGVVLAICAVVVFFAFKWIKAKREGEQGMVTGKGGDSSESEVAVPVKVVTVSTGDLPLRLTITAETDAREKVTVKNEVEGRVEKIYFREGAMVRKGDVVVKLESQEKDLALLQAQANRLRALSTFQSDYLAIEKKTSGDAPTSEWKMQYLEALEKFQKGEVSRQELEKVETKMIEQIVASGQLQEETQRAVAQLTQTEVELARTRLDIERTWIRAPFPGTISAIKVSPGEKVSLGMEVYRIVNLASVYMKGYVLETELRKIKVGSKARIRFLGMPEGPVMGRVAAISPEIDLEKKTGFVFIDFPNPGDIRAGVNAEVDIEYDVRPGVIKIPRQALVVRQNRTLIFVVENNVALWKYIETGASNEEEIEVVSGEVNDGAQVVVEGHLTLAHQSKVKVLDE